MDSTEDNNIQLIENIFVHDTKDVKGFKKIFKNFSYLTFGKIAGDFFNFILFVVISREFGQDGIGKYSFAFGLTAFFSILADFGLYDFSVKEISRSRNSFEDKLRVILSLRFFQCLVMISILFMIIPFLNFPGDSKTIIVIIGLYQIIYILIDGLAAVFVALEHMHIAGTISASSRIMTCLVGILVAIFSGNLVLSLLFFPIISIIQLIVLGGYVHKKVCRLGLILSRKKLIAVFKQTVPYGISDFFIQIYLRIDIVLIGFLVGEAAAGVYNVGYRVIFFLLFIPNFAGVSIFPTASRVFHNSRNEFNKLYNNAINSMILIGLPVSAGLWLIAPQLIIMIFGKNFVESVTILRILSGLFMLKCVGSIMGIFMMSSDNQNEYAKNQVIITVFSFIANFILIYLYGIEGAAVATILTALLLVSIYSFKLKAVIGLPNIKYRLFIGLLGVAAFCGLFSFFNTVSFFLIIPISAIIYLGILIAFRDIRRNELKMFLNMIGLKKQAQYFS